MLIADEPDMPGNSGPTVVDDAKVAEVLKKLRSLDTPGAPGGVAEVVLDSGSSEPTRLDSGAIEIDSGPASGPVGTGVAKLLRSSQRTTAVGRSLATPVVGQPVTIPADLARGTLFGRSIHVPDVNAPDGEAIDLESGAVSYLDGTPPPSQPFPLAENLVLAPPTSKPMPVYDAGTGSFSESGLNTQLVAPPKSRAFVKTLAFLGGIGIIAGGFWAWQQRGRWMPPDAPTATAPAAPEPAKPAPPPSDPMPAAAAAAEEPAAGAAKPAAAPSTAEAAPAPGPAKPEAAHAADAPAKATASAGDEPAPPARGKQSSRQHGRRSSASTERRSGKTAGATPADTSDTPEPAAKPGHGNKRGEANDPDDTMAPSI